MQPSVNNNPNFCPKCGAESSEGPQCLQCGVYYEKVFRRNPPSIEKKRRFPIKSIAFVAISLLAIFTILLAMKPGALTESSRIHNNTDPVTVDSGVKKDYLAYLGDKVNHQRAKEDYWALLPLIESFLPNAQSVVPAYSRFILRDERTEIVRIFTELISLEIEIKKMRSSGCVKDVKEALLFSVQKNGEFIAWGMRNVWDNHEALLRLRARNESMPALTKAMVACGLTLFPETDFEAIQGIERFR
jgi:hypothetical protein